MIVCPILSGSSGNATYVESGSTRILIDAGGTGSQLKQLLSTIGVDPCTLTALLVTHAHDDHIKGVGIMSRNYNLPIHASAGVWGTMQNKNRLGRISKCFMKPFYSASCQPISFGDITARYFSTPHDSYDSVGYVLDDGKAKFGLATDLGHITPRVRENLLGCDVVLLEANYDYDMLINGPYPYPLQQRVLGPEGHLQNEEAGKFAAELVRSGTKHIFLGHLSKNNNTIELAYHSVANVLREEGIEPGVDCNIYMTRRDEPSRKLEF